MLPQPMRVAILFLVLALPRVVDAQCVNPRIDDRLNRGVVLAFVGTVREVEEVSVGQVVTFSVSRVYKGHVGERVVVYYERDPLAPGEGIGGFRQAGSYLVLAYRQSAEQRHRFKLPPDGSESLEVPDCRAYSTDAAETVRWVLGGARGYAPRPHEHQ